LNWSHGEEWSKMWQLRTMQLKCFASKFSFFASRNWIEGCYATTKSTSTDRLSYHWLHSVGRTFRKRIGKNQVYEYCVEVSGWKRNRDTFCDWNDIGLFDWYVRWSTKIKRPTLLFTKATRLLILTVQKIKASIFIDFRFSFVFRIDEGSLIWVRGKMNHLLKTSRKTLTRTAKFVLL